MMEARSHNSLAGLPSSGAEHSDTAVANQIASLVSGYSIETIPTSLGGGAVDFKSLVRGSEVYIAHPPKATLDEVVAAAIRVQQAGYKAVPHLVARKLLSVAQLEAALKQLEDGGVTRLLVIAGDAGDPDGAFDSTLDIFYTGMLERYGFREIGFAGHPEGNRNIGATLLAQALSDKLDYAAQSPSSFHIVTQFGFDAGAVIGFERHVRSMGHDIPVHIGIAGITGMKRLLMYATRCGVRSSLGLLMDRSDIIKGVANSAPDLLVRQFASHMLDEPESLFAKSHFFAFGGLDQTAAWANAVAAGKFELSDEAGFSISA